MVKTGKAIITVEVRTYTCLSLEEIIGEVNLKIEYHSSDVGFDGVSCAVIHAIGKRASDIALGFKESGDKKLGVRDQGLMLGVARHETDGLMSAHIYYAQR